MTVRRARPRWQTTACLVVGLAVFVFEVGLNAVTGRPADYTIIGGSMGMMGLGPILSSARSRQGTDNADNNAEQ